MSTANSSNFNRFLGIFFSGFGLITFVIVIVDKAWNWSGLGQAALGTSFLLLGIDYFKRAIQGQMQTSPSA
jgi:hypothetical protein